MPGAAVQLWLGGRGPQRGLACVFAFSFDDTDLRAAALKRGLLRNRWKGRVLFSQETWKRRRMSHDFLLQVLGAHRRKHCPCKAAALKRRADVLALSRKSQWTGHWTPTDDAPLDCGIHHQYLKRPRNRGPDRSCIVKGTPPSIQFCIQV